MAFVGRDHLLNVAKHLTLFINHPETFDKYRTPPQTIDDQSLTDNPELKKELIKTFALASAVYEDDLAESGHLPFAYSEADLAEFRTEERALKEKMSFVDLFGDMAGLGLELTEKDYVSDRQLETHLEKETPKDKEALLQYIKSERGGKGLAKCYPLAYIQGNFAHYHLKS